MTHTNDPWLNRVTQTIQSGEGHAIPRDDAALEVRLTEIGLTEDQVYYIMELFNDQRKLGYEEGRVSMGAESYRTRRDRIQAEIQASTGDYRATFG